MKSTATLTIVKMLEGLPETIQDRVVEHLRDYIEDMREEAQWAESFSQSQEKLASLAQQARKDKAEGRANSMDFGKL
jgi:predicted house-cleaning noncanonical NTP pyrophosphatase (MazG superfamily)